MVERLLIMKEMVDLPLRIREKVSFKRSPRRNKNFLPPERVD